MSLELPPRRTDRGAVPGMIPAVKFSVLDDNGSAAR